MERPAKVSRAAWVVSRVGHEGQISPWKLWSQPQVHFTRRACTCCAGSRETTALYSTSHGYEKEKGKGPRIERVEKQQGSHAVFFSSGS